MSPLPHNGQSSFEENDALTDDSISIATLMEDFLCFPPDILSDSTSTFDQNDTSTLPSTRDISHRPSESSETIMLGNFSDGGTSDKSFTFDDPFSCYERGDDGSTQKIPFIVVPGLLQGHNDVPPPPPSNGKAVESHQVDENANYAQENVVPRCTVFQRGEGAPCTDEDFFLGSRVVRTPSPVLTSGNITISEHPSIEEWVTGNRPILQDYADRQISLPVGRRLEVSVDEPSQSVLAALKLLVNRDQEGYTEPSRRLGPQLIENFAEIDRWAKEYLRSRHHTRVVDSEVTTLLTIVINNFYEAQIELIDRLVTRALQNMQTGGRSSLSLEDFAVGFDFQMSQDLPFYVGQTRSRFREPQPIRAVEVEPTSEPVTTNSGRQVKPTQRAQQASGSNRGDRRNKGKKAPKVKEQQPASGPVTAARQKKSTAKPSSNHAVTETPVQSEDVTRPTPPNVTVVHTKYRPIVPSNLGQFSVLSFSPPTIAARTDDNPELAPSGSTSADRPSTTCSSGSNTAPQSMPRLTIKLPALPVNTPASTVPAPTDSAPPSTESANPSETAPRGCGSKARPRGPRNGGRGRGGGTVTATPDAEPPEATTPDSAHTVLMARPVGEGDATTSATPDAMAVLREFFLSLTSAAGTTAIAQPHTEADDDNNDTRDENASTPQSSQSLAPPVDPGHPERKKRKLDDCGD